MKKLLTVTAALVAAVFLAGPVVAGKAGNALEGGASVIVIDDKASAFTAEGIQKAESTFNAVEFRSPAYLTIVTYKAVPENKRSDYEAAKGDKAKKADFFGAWTRELATKRASRGVFVLVSVEGGHIHALDDRQTDAKRGFGDSELKKLEEKLSEGFKKATPIADPTDAKKARDEGLLSAVNFVVAELKNTAVPETPHPVAKKENNGGNWLAHNWWVILVAVLGVWLLIGIMRALAGGGGGGGGGYGGGGGGFMSGLLGGMFGAMAGMYLYNNVFGGGMSSASAGDSYGGDGGSYDTGAGDYAGGGDGGGTDFDGGDFGGGDAGGGDAGGGDWGGGGGDFGGGDFGGGGGDW